MEWFKKLPCETQLYLVQILNLLGTLNCIYLAIWYDAWTWYLCASWTLTAVFLCMKKEKELYRDYI